MHKASQAARWTRGSASAVSRARDLSGVERNRARGPRPRRREPRPPAAWRCPGRSADAASKPPNSSTRISTARTRWHSRSCSSSTRLLESRRPVVWPAAPSGRATSWPAADRRRARRRAATRLADFRTSGRYSATRNTLPRVRRPPMATNKSPSGPTARSQGAKPTSPVVSHEISSLLLAGRCRRLRAESK